ncbi:MAG: hypothetical protein HYV02_08050 [Deltaproteobacteria bacterium]|nr:hypothetical protein [Deltaproteobacteria bacterium]
MAAIGIQDCVYVPAPKRYTVEQVIAVERARIAAGTRLDTNYDHVSTPSLDPASYRAAGYASVPIASSERPLDLAVMAVEQLLANNALPPAAVDALLYYDAIPWPEDTTINMPSRLAELTGMMDLRYVAHVTQRNCASSIAAIEAAWYVMSARPDIHRVIVAGGDCVATHCGEPRVVNHLIFGDAGSAVLLSREGGPIHYVASRCIPQGGRRYREPLETLRTLAVKGVQWSLHEYERAFTQTGFTADDMEFIVTNNPPLNRAMDRLTSYPRTKRTIIDDHVREYALTSAHIAIGCLMEVLRRGAKKPVALHATGLGTTLCTMIFTPTRPMHYGHEKGTHHE